MKESILDVLLYLFEHYFTNEALAVPGDDFTAQDGPLVGELTEAEVDAFIATQVRPALDQVARELSARGRPAHVVEEDGGAVALRSPAEGVRDFIYGVSRSAQPVATTTPREHRSRRIAALPPSSTVRPATRAPRARTR